jgi:electron transfer flavoprotein beta subunit
MKLLVCISQTPDTTAKISFKDDSTKYDEAGVPFIINPYDEWYALVKAIEIVEKQGGSVTALTVGGSDTETNIRKALAIGADEAVRVDAQPDDSLFVATQIAHYAKDKGFDILFFGKETIDHNGSIVPAMVAELMDIPFVSYANQMEIEGNKAMVSREISGGTETIQVETPFALSAAKGMAEQRIPNMRGIMMARKKPLEVVEAVDCTPLVSLERFELPPSKGKVKMINPDNMEELVRLLHEEAKVI